MKRLLPLLFVAGCATSEPRIITKEVLVPVPVPCFAEPYPAKEYAADKVPLDSPLFELVKALLIDRDQRQVTERELRAERKACEQ